MKSKLSHTWLFVTIHNTWHFFSFLLPNKVKVFAARITFNLLICGMLHKMSAAQDSKLGGRTRFIFCFCVMWKNHSGPKSFQKEVSSLHYNIICHGLEYFIWKILNLDTSCCRSNCCPHFCVRDRIFKESLSHKTRVEEWIHIHAPEMPLVVSYVGRSNTDI